MRLLLAALPALALVPAFATAVYADDKPPVDLVAAIVIGAADGATWSFAGQITGVLKETSPGVFEAQTSNNGPLAQFAVTEKAKCVYDLTFSLDKAVQGGLELDATKLKTVSFTPAAPNAGGWNDYTITVTGEKGVVQNIGTDGTLSDTDTSSTLSTSLTNADLTAAVTALQAVCPPTE